MEEEEPFLQSLLSKASKFLLALGLAQPMLVN